MSDEEDYYDEEDGDDVQGIEGDVQIDDRSNSHSTQVITKESLLEAQSEDLYRVMDLLGLTERHARALLIHHRWDVERLFAMFVEKGKDRLFADAGIAIVETKKRSLLQMLSRSQSPVTCNICFDNVSGDAVTTMDCGHCFCNGCWREHFLVKISDGESRHIRCMEHKCNAICDEAVVRHLVSMKRPDMAKRFDRYLLESYIEDNKKVKWCPSVPHCGNAIRIEKGDCYCEVECRCGLQFCFNCLAEAHSPCSYKHAFWLCGQSYGNNNHGSGHGCGRYKPDTEKAMRAKKDLHRYIHYHNRYQAHRDSLKLETKLKETITRRIAISEINHCGLKDYSWLMNGLFRLFRSRRVLSFSYPFAFYMFGDDLFENVMKKEVREMKQNLFEHQQQLLEGNVEKLSLVLEEPFDEFTIDKLSNLRMQIINLTAVTDKLCRQMYECIDNELLGDLPFLQNIAPYHSMGVERALEFKI
ncbi:hypothetical protein ACLOJK_041141 [Asimina triloba]